MESKFPPHVNSSTRKMIVSKKQKTLKNCKYTQHQDNLKNLILALVPNLASILHRALISQSWTKLYHIRADLIRSLQRNARHRTPVPQLSRKSVWCRDDPILALQSRHYYPCSFKSSQHDTPIIKKENVLCSQIFTSCWIHISSVIG